MRARKTRSSARIAMVSFSRLSAAPTASISASTAGSAVPGRFREPDMTAAREWNSPSISSRVGVAVNEIAIEVRSKSKSACRAAYCAESTCRIEASMPIARMFSTHGEMTRMKLSSSIRYSSRQAFALVVGEKRCPGASSRPRRAASTPATAACGRAPSRRKPAALPPRRRPPAGALPRNGSSSASSCGDGSPSAL